MISLHTPENKKKPWKTFFMWGGGAVGGLLAVIGSMASSGPHDAQASLVAGKTGGEAAIAGTIIGAVVGSLVDKKRGAK